MSLAALGVVALLAACGSDEENPSTSAAEGASATATGPAASPLDGTWQTAAISPRAVEANLRRHGLAKWIKRFRAETPIPATRTLILELEDGEWDLYAQPAGEARAEVDYDAEYVVDGDTVEKVHATGVTTYRWSVEGDTLSFRWLKTTEPAFKGIPDEVFSRALYMTEPFKRRG
jgi:hypothetical protein